MPCIQTFFLRVSARCNLACDYCYVFKHADTSWKQYPPSMSEGNVILFADRLRHYVEATNLKDINIVYHGGEPLLIGASRLLKFTDAIVERLQGATHAAFSLQTNGTLLTDAFLEECQSRNICISLSIDGPEHIHNRHRVTPSGAGSFEQVSSGIRKLQGYPQLFQGVIGVIDPRTDPGELLRFYSEANLHSIDLLLPDANHEVPPPYYNRHPDMYADWLTRAFDLWFDEYQGVSIRTFECILKCLTGIDASNDIFGLGELSYLTIETDGSYHTTDILKSTYNNASGMGISLENATVMEAVTHRKMKEYNALLTLENLPAKCKECDVGGICAGGSMPHRYSKENSFRNPTVYCHEMKTLLRHAKRRLEDELDRELTRNKSVRSIDNNAK